MTPLGANSLSLAGFEFQGQAGLSGDVPGKRPSGFESSVTSPASAWGLLNRMSLELVSSDYLREDGQ